jgi:uncharacterized membrane protein YeaQ/YmgE (transglycosylase-associated protein family)
MDLISLVIFIAVGAAVGWLVALVKKRGRFGLILNIGIGILGAMLAGFLYGLLGLTTFGWTGALVAAVVGPLVLFLLVGMFKRS